MKEKQKLSLALKYLARNIYPKSFNIGVTEQVIISKKKEGLVNLYTINTSDSITKIMDGRHLQSRRWIKRKKKRSLVALKELQKRSFFFPGCSVILNRKKPILSAYLEQNFKVNVPLPFNSFNFFSSYVTSTVHFFTAWMVKPEQSLLFILKPVKGGFKIYFEGALGFLRKRQGKRLFKVLAKKYRWKVQQKKRKHNLNYVGVFPKAILCYYFKKFKLKCKFAGFYSKKKFVKARTKKLRLRIRARLQFTFRLFRLKSRYKGKKRRKKKKKHLHFNLKS